MDEFLFFDEDFILDFFENILAAAMNKYSLRLLLLFLFNCYIFNVFSIIYEWIGGNWIAAVVYQNQSILFYV